MTAQRMSIRETDREAYRAVLGLSTYAKGGTLDPGLLALVDIRASQINHCAWCLDMHAEEAREAGISQRQIDLVAAWEEAGALFSSRQRAALAYTEAVTLIADAGVPDDVWNALREEFDEKEIARLTVAIGAINVWNRINVSTRTELGPEPYKV